LCGGQPLKMENPHTPIKGITTHPRGNPQTERIDVERGLAKLARIVGN
jgi:hypothetical protein